MLKIAQPLLLAVFINLCLFVGELATLIAYRGVTETRKNIDGLAHILTGPISVISFYSSDSLGTVLFFGSLWHFLCDCAATRPT